MMRKIERCGWLVACVAVLAAPVRADTVSEWSSDTAAVPGIILPIGGSGQVNGNFVVAEGATDTGTVQIGIRANRRFSPVPLTRSGNDYFIEPGESGPGLPLWNYDLHVDLRDSGSTLSDYVVSLVTDVPNHGFADLQAVLDGPFGPDPSPEPDHGGVTLFQTSQNPGFFLSGIDPFAPGVYNFTLSLVPRNDEGLPELSVDMAVHVVPLPSAALSGISLLLGVGTVLAIRRRGT